MEEVISAGTRAKETCEDFFKLFHTINQNNQITSVNNVISLELSSKEKIFAHSDILSIRWPYVIELLNQQQQSQNLTDNNLVVSDMSKSDALNILDWVYSGGVPNIFQNGILQIKPCLTLMTLSRKFRLPQLFNYCSSLLRVNKWLILHQLKSEDLIEYSKITPPLSLNDTNQYSTSFNIFCRLLLLEKG